MRRFNVILALTVLCGLVTLALPGPVAAANPCIKDAQKFCKDVKRGGGRIIDCLKKHESELSPDCKAHFEKVHARMAKKAEACGPDIEKFCKDVKPGEGRVIKCLKEHAKELQPACKQRLDRKK